jgi:hypothetical protein
MSRCMKKAVPLLTDLNRGGRDRVADQKTERDVKEMLDMEKLFSALRTSAMRRGLKSTKS